MSKNMIYRANSVIYNKGSQTSFFYVIKSGKVSLSPSIGSSDSYLSEEQIIGEGEFFGVRESLCGDDADQTATAIEDSQIIALTHTEFESAAMKNSTIVLKLLRVYSKQLADVHRTVQLLMTKNGSFKETSNEAGLYNVALYFVRNRLYSQATEVLNRYINSFPSGQFYSEAVTKVSYCQAKVSSMDDMSDRFYPDKNLNNSAAAPVIESIASSAFKEAKALFSAKKHAQAVIKFGRIMRETDTLYKPFIEESSYLSGESLFSLQKYNEVVEDLSLFMQRYPESQYMQNVLYLIAKSYEALGDKNLSLIFYQQLYAMLPDGSPLKSQIRKNIGQ